VKSLWPAGLVLLLLTTPGAAEAHPGQVACWSAQGHANDPVGSHNGALEGEAAYDVGYLGLGFSYQGNRSVTVPDASELQLNHITLLAWVRPVLIDGHEDIIVNKESTEGPIEYEIGIRGSDHPGGVVPRQGSRWPTRGRSARGRLCGHQWGGRSPRDDHLFQRPRSARASLAWDPG
jgi:hypothetical protein